MASATSDKDTNEDIGTFDVPRYYGLESGFPAFSMRFEFNHHCKLDAAHCHDWIGLFPCGWSSLENAIQKHSVSSGVIKRDPRVVKLQFFAPRDSADSWYQFVYVSSADTVKAKSDIVTFGSDPTDSSFSSQPSSYSEQGRCDEPYGCGYDPLEASGHQSSGSVSVPEEEYLSRFDRMLRGIDALRSEAVHSRMACEERFRNQEKTIRSHEQTIDTQQETIHQLQCLLDTIELEKREREQEVDRLQRQVTDLQRTLDDLHGYIPRDSRRSDTERRSSCMSTGDYSSSGLTVDRSSHPLLGSLDVDEVAVSSQNRKRSSDQQDNPPLMTDVYAEGEHIGQSELGRVVWSQTEHPENGLHEQQLGMLENGMSTTHQSAQLLRESFLGDDASHLEVCTSQTSPFLEYVASRDSHEARSRPLSPEGQTGDPSVTSGGTVSYPIHGLLLSGGHSSSLSYGVESEANRNEANS
ncbi:uncharacterized protein LOC134194594 [Corticium candelabrum]|uniref:uncharacterized protein LOC134194594 n=1 Tax=Corticium candelabrum TaxID=121492 RepID=UPI002E272E0C|nr:uncharacterized protein LOC134194594 [Corticium candelabrum]